MTFHPNSRLYILVLLGGMVACLIGAPLSYAIEKSSSNGQFETHTADRPADAEDSPAVGDVSNRHVSPATYSEKGFSFEKLQADVYVQSGQVIISGLVRNEQRLPLKGYVHILLLDKDGGIIKSIDSEVNGNKDIASKKTGAIDLVTMVPLSSIGKINQLYVEFVK